MYLSYLLDKDNGMYPNSARHPAQTLTSHLPGSPQYLPPPSLPPYGDFTAYHHISGLCEPLGSQSPGVWNPAYATPWEEWSAYGHGAGFPGSNLSGGQAVVDRGFGTPDLTSVTVPPSNSLSPRQYSPNSPKRKSEWIRQYGHPSHSGGKTRTKDKYRVVYSDQQRLDLEREFQYSRYITIRRKAELALTLCLSERQVKIWFQNRRAKERKVNRRKVQLSQQASTTTPTPLGPTDGPTDGPVTINPSSDLLPDEISMAVKEEY